VDGGAVDSVVTPVRLAPLLHRQIADLVAAAAVGSASDDPDRLPPLVDGVGELGLVHPLAYTGKVILVIVVMTLALPHRISNLFTAPLAFQDLTALYRLDARPLGGRANF
jgi:hypothetical protein